MKKLDMVVLGILITSGVNWGLWGFFNFNLMEYIIGNAWIVCVIYIIFGASALYYVFRWNHFFGRKPRK